MLSCVYTILYADVNVVKIYNVFNLQEVNFSEDNQYIALTKNSKCVNVFQIHSDFD